MLLFRNKILSRTAKKVLKVDGYSEEVIAAATFRVLGC